MRGTKAKALRRQVYGEEYSIWERRYMWIDGSIRNTGRRAVYQEMKKYYVSGSKPLPQQGRDK